MAWRPLRRRVLHRGAVVQLLQRTPRPHQQELLPSCDALLERTDKPAVSD